MNKCSIKIEFDIEEVPNEEFRSLIEEKIKLSFLNLKVKNLFYDIGLTYPTAVSGRVVLGEVPFKKVFSNLFGRKTFSINNKNYIVNMNSKRLLVFKENRRCVCCKILGEKMLLEYHPYDGVPHFNFYAIYKNDLLLMTKDHIIPKSVGGEDIHSNYQTMCSLCNNLKGHSNLTLESLRKLRKVYDKNVDVKTKKELHLILEETSNRLSRKKISKIETFPNYLEVRCDLFCHQISPVQFVGVPINDFDFTKYKKVGSIKKGTFLLPLLKYNSKSFVFEINSSQSVIINRANIIYN